MKKTEVNAYYKMLRLIFELNRRNNNKFFLGTKEQYEKYIKTKGKPIEIPVLTFLDNFHKYWNKYYSKEFKKS